MASNTSNVTPLLPLAAAAANCSDDTLLPPGWSPAAMASDGNSNNGSSLAALLGLGTNTTNNVATNNKAAAVPLQSQLATAAAALNMSTAHLQQLLLAGSVAMAQQPVGVVMPSSTHAIPALPVPMSSLAQQYGAVTALQPLNGLLHSSMPLSLSSSNGSISSAGESSLASTSSSSSNGNGVTAASGAANHGVSVQLSMIKPLAPPASRKKRTSRDSTDSIKTSRMGRDEDDSESISSSVAAAHHASSDEPKRRRGSHTSVNTSFSFTPSSPSARVAAAGAVAQARAAAAQSNKSILQSYPGSSSASSTASFSDNSSTVTSSSRRSATTHHGHGHGHGHAFDGISAIIPSSSSSSSSSLLSPGSSVDNGAASGMEPPILLRQLYDAASWTDVFARVSEILKRDRVRQKTAAEQVRLSSSTLSPMLKNKYKHTKEEHVIRLRDWSWARDSTMWQNVQIQAARCSFDHVGLACAIGVTTDEVVNWMNGTTPLLQRYQLDTTLANWLKSQSAATPLTAMASLNTDDNTVPSSPNSDSALPSPRSTASVASVCSSPLAPSAIGRSATAAGAKTRSGSQRSAKNPSPVPSGNGMTASAAANNGHVSPTPWSTRTPSNGSNGIPHLSATSPSPRARSSSSSQQASPGGNAWSSASSPPISRGISPPTIIGTANMNGRASGHKSGMTTSAAMTNGGNPASARAFWAGPNAVYPTVLLTPTSASGNGTKLESPVPSSSMGGSVWRPIPTPGRHHQQPYNDVVSVGLSFSMSPAKPNNNGHNGNHITLLASPAMPAATSSSSAAAATASSLSSSYNNNHMSTAANGVSSTNTVQSIPLSSSSSSSSSSSVSLSSTLSSTHVNGGIAAVTKSEPSEHTSAAFDLCSLAVLATTDANIPSSSSVSSLSPAAGKENAIPTVVTSQSIGSMSSTTAMAPTSPLLFKKSGSAVRRAPPTVTSPSLSSASNGRVRTAAANNPHVHRKSGAMTINPQGHHHVGHTGSNGNGTGNGMTSLTSPGIRGINGVMAAGGLLLHGNGQQSSSIASSPSRSHSRGRSLAAHAASHIAAAAKVSQPIVGHAL